nr:putative mitochondrial protein [Tanacetum cinerariifolium]
WGEDATNAFEALKKAMAELPMLALPDSNQLFVIEADASGVVGGHSGVLKTFKRMALELYWIVMKKDIEKLIADCVIYQRQKYSTMTPGGLLQPLELPTKIWVEVSMDFIDGLPKQIVIL